MVLFAVYLAVVVLTVCREGLASSTWWPRLMTHHVGEVAWDDDEKDFSDLPSHLKPLPQHELQEEEGDEAEADGWKTNGHTEEDVEAPQSSAAAAGKAAASAACVDAIAESMLYMPE